MQDLFIGGEIGRLAVRVKGLERHPTQAVILVQGANLTGQLGYDFSFSGSSDYSMMDALVARGLGVVTFSIRGYGLSDAPSDPLTVDTDAAMRDLATIVEWARSQGFARPHLVGWSWGGRISGRFTEAHGERIDRLVLLDPALGGGNRIPFDPATPWWSNTQRYFCERLEAEYMDLNARTALGAQAEANEPRAPNGIRLENERGSIPVEAARISRPTLMLYGEGAAKQNYMQGGIKRADFFERLATAEKSLAIVPDGGDYAHLQNARLRIHELIGEFLC